MSKGGSFLAGVGAGAAAAMSRQKGSSYTPPKKKKVADAPQPEELTSFTSDEPDQLSGPPASERYSPETTAEAQDANDRIESANGGYVGSGRDAGKTAPPNNPYDELAQAAPKEDTSRRRGQIDKALEEAGAADGGYVRRYKDGGYVGKPPNLKAGEDIGGFEPAEPSGPKTLGGISGSFPKKGVTEAKPLETPIIGVRMADGGEVNAEHYATAGVGYGMSPQGSYEMDRYKENHSAHPCTGFPNTDCTKRDWGK